jgi:hypothetical protein
MGHSSGIYPSSCYFCFGSFGLLVALMPRELEEGANAKLREEEEGKRESEVERTNSEGM